MRALWLVLALGLLLVAGCRSARLSSSRARTPVRVEGNERVKSKDLLEAAERELTTWRQKARAADADDAAFAMETLLLDEGYADGRVRFEEEGDGLVFHVEEGPRYVFAGVRFEGVSSLPESTLRKFFAFEPDGILGFGEVHYSEEDVRAAESRVVQAYRFEGFYQVVVGPHRKEQGPCGVTVIVPVSEGRRYTIAEVRIVGADRCWLGSDLPIGAPLRRRSAVLLSGEVRGALHEAGYAFAKVKGRTAVDHDTSTGVVTITVEQGEQTRLRCIQFEGECRTKEWFMRRRVPLRYGDVLRRSRIECGVADLYRSNAFDAVGVTVVPTGPGQADLRYDVKEGRARRLDLEVGWGTWELARAKATYKDFNVLGTGRILRASALMAVRAQEATLGLEDRWILGRHARLWIETAAVHRQEPFYTFVSTGVQVGAERLFSRRHRIRGSYVFSATDAFDVAAVLPPDVQRELDRFSRTAGLTAEYRFDSRDDHFLPTSGTIADFGVLFSAPELGATLEYVQLEADATHHFDLGRAGVLAVGAFAGTRQPFGRTDDLPIQDRYFLGGLSSIRAYGLDELTPTDMFGNGVGGLTASEAHIEWRRQIVGILYGAAFGEAGVVSLDPFSWNGAFGYGAGLGLRVYTPVGPVRLDAAYNPGDLHAANSRFQAFFAFGFSF